MESGVHDGGRLPRAVRIAQCIRCDRQLLAEPKSIGNVADLHADHHVGVCTVLDPQVHEGVCTLVGVCLCDGVAKLVIAKQRWNKRRIESRDLEWSSDLELVAGD